MIFESTALILLCLLISRLEASLFFPSTDIHDQLHRSIIFAERLKDPAIKQTLSFWGVVHLMVISGFHFDLALKLSSRLNSPLIDRFLPYLLLCLWGPQIPVLRAFFFVLLKRLSVRRKLGLSPYLILCLSGILCLVWIDTNQELGSFWLSFCFSVLCLQFQGKGLKGSFKLNLIIFILTPVILPFTTNLGLLSLFANMFLSLPLLFILGFSPLLHLLPEGHKYCQTINMNLFEAMGQIGEKLNYSHPYGDGGVQHASLLILFFLIAWRLSIKLRRSQFVASL